MKHWFSRDLQNIILHYAAENPENTISAHGVIANRLMSNKYTGSIYDKNFYKNDLLYIIKNLHSPLNEIVNEENLEIVGFDKLKHIILCNILYLIDHHLLKYKLLRKQNFHTKETEYIEDINRILITAKGIDFLAHDGGLSSILGVVTIKLHNDTLQALLTDRIDQAEISDAEKGNLKNALSTIKEAGLVKITEMAIENAPWTSLFAAITKAVGLP